MTVSVRVFNSTIPATLTQSATTACTATRVAAVSSTKKSMSVAPRMRLAGAKPCAYSRPRYPLTGHARKYFQCLRAHLCCPCTRQIWQILTLGCSCINRISRRSAGLDISIKLVADASLDSNPKIRYGFK